MDLINIAISSILSGILGVAISTYYHNRMEKRKYANSQSMAIHKVKITL